jgi:extracellular factor (EF) 3-hydroxypalmitic acid methyl ester biosynthesis protein
MTPTLEVDKESIIVCENSQGTAVRATLLRMTRYLISFEVYNPYSILQLSEVLSNFRIIISGNTVYNGRATVNNIVNTGLVLVCEATLDEESWLDVEILSPALQVERLAGDFERLVSEWSKIEQVSPELKLTISDIQTLLGDMRRWMEQVELAIRSSPSGERGNLETQITERLNLLILPVLQEQFIRFESLAGQVSQDAQSIHRAYCRRQLHPLVLCSPLVHRTFYKPLGYAGDYEMVNMILRQPFEGGSLFAKILNCFFLMVPPGEAHRNRITYLANMLETETRRNAKTGKRTRILNLGCGPAKEVQNFLAYNDLCERADFVLLDFNDETLESTNQTLQDIRMRHNRGTPIAMIKRSVHQIVKEGLRMGDGEKPTFEVIYCAGLFDYLSDRICRRLIEIFYDHLAPGGMLVTTNVDISNPARHVMEYIMEWHLIYRDTESFGNLVPASVPKGSSRILPDPTGINIFMEIRKPEIDARKP